MTRDVSEGRKTAYYLGIVLQVIGGLLFASTFVTFMLNFGDFTDFEGRAKLVMFRAFGGMALLILGGIIRGIGARGLAGSGVVLDPKKARSDLEPYARMAGGMLKDAMEEADLSPGRPPAKPIIMIKCTACGKLNEEDSKFCQECGVKL